MRSFIAVAFSLLVANLLHAQGGPKNRMPEFPPGYFSDGNVYRMEDLKGKVVVLYFFESGCPRCLGSIPERNAVVRAMADKPVAFFAIGANLSPLQAQQYQRTNGLEMPIFADTYGLMQSRHGTGVISLQNIWQYRMFDGEGRVVSAVELSKDSVEKALSRGGAVAQYKTPDLPPKLLPIANLFELGQYSLGVKQMTAARKTAKKGDLPAINGIQDAFKKQGETWSAEAEAAKSSDPVRAYDLYTRVATYFPADETGKSALKSSKALAADKDVKAELAARPAYNKVASAMAQVNLPTREALAAAFADVAKKHSSTPTGRKAKTLAEELGAKK